MKDKLSIIIPTYNRWDTLAKTLENTLANNSVGVTVVILDNNSDLQGRDLVLKVIEKYPEISCRIEKNERNIGGDANIVRCIEICETPYVLVLGDDDFLSADYIEKISFYLMQDIGWGFIGFRDRAGGWDNKVFDSAVEMLECSGNWADLLFISTGIINKAMFAYGMRFAQRSQITHSAHLVGLLKGWQESVAKGHSWKFALSKEQLIVSGGHARDHRSFELMSIYAGLPSLEFMFEDKRLHYAVRSAVRVATKRMFKPRVLAKEFFYFTLKFGFELSWRRVMAMRRGLSYSIGSRSLFYRIYLPFVVLIAALISAWSS